MVTFINRMHRDKRRHRRAVQIVGVLLLESPSAVRHQSKYVQYIYIAQGRNNVNPVKRVSGLHNNRRDY